MARALRTSADRARFPRPSVFPCPLPRPGPLSYDEHAQAVGRTPPRGGLCVAAVPRGFFPRAAPPVRGLPHNTPSTQARDELGIELRSFYRTSPPAADRWVHRARYEVRFSASFSGPPRRHRRDPLRKTQAKRGDKAKQALAPALKFKAVDEKAFDKLARNVERLAAGSVATTEWARAEGGGAAAPLAEVAELASPPAGEDEYGHEVVDVANGAAAAAFLAAGHGVIDVAAMLGLRVDAHPGSTAGGTDGLHFCMPGPLDYALDIVLSRVGSAFDRGGAEIDGGFGGLE